MIDEKVLIERLGEVSSKAEQNMNYYKDLSEEDASCEVFADASEKEYKAFQKSIDIVNQLAEEHSHCMLCYLRSPCEYQNENAIFPVELLKDENGWIPCEVRLPSKEEYQKCNGQFIVSDGNRTYAAYFDIYDTLKFGEPTITKFKIDRCVVAWQPLPAPYKPKNEH